MKKNKNYAFRISEKDLNRIKQKAKLSKMTTTDYITYSALNKKIIIIDDLKNIITQLKYIGNNLNQITTLANMEKLYVVDLREINQSLLLIHNDLKRLSELN